VWRSGWPIYQSLLMLAFLFSEEITESVDVIAKALR
jgi:hypothetical protein